MNDFAFYMFCLGGIVGAIATWVLMCLQLWREA
jgi:hypothetical protein